MDAELTGRRLGVYQLHERIGAGGMGEVYRARDTRLQRDVAVEILPHTFTAESDRRARFEREARVLASLNHPNIATIHGVEDADGIHALVMELVEGETIAGRLEARAGAGPEALAMARQIADALDTAHEPRDRPSGSEARQHQGDIVGAGEGSGLRLGQGRRRR